MKNVKLENWAVCFLPQDVLGASVAGVSIPGRLTGEVYGHERIADGENVTTTPMLDQEGRLITTQSGTVYELGMVKADYADFVHTLPGKEDWDFGGDNPVELHGDEVSDEKMSEFKREEARIKDIVNTELEFAIMPTPETKH